MNVKLDRIGAGSDSLRKRLDGILGRERAIAPVPDYRTSSGIEKNIHP